MTSKLLAALPLALATLIVAVLASAPSAQAIPTYTDYCSNCHPPDSGVAMAVRLMAANDATATYSVEVSSTPGLSGWAVFGDSGKVTYGLRATGQFTVPVGSSYTVYGVAHQTNHSRSVVVTPRTPASLSLAASSTCAYGSARLVGSLKTAKGAFIVGKRVRVQSSPNGSSWSTVSAFTTGTGRSVVRMAPKKKTSYRLVFIGDASFEATTSAARVVVPRALVGVPSAPSRVRHSKTFTVSGTISPAKASGVRLRIYRLRSGVWSLHSTYACAVSHGTYTRRIMIKSKGTWSMRARFGGDAVNGAAFSGYRKVTVR